MIITAGGGVAGGSEDAEGFWDKITGIFKRGGESGKISTSNIPANTKKYLETHGNNGSKDTIFCSIGGNSVMNNGKLSCGLGNNRGTGGDHHSWMVNNFISKCDHTDRGTTGVGGCLYILSTGTYCVVNIDIPDGAKIVVDVTGDDVQPITNYVDNNSSINRVKVNRLEKNGDISFIVRKGAKVSYTVTKDHYNTGRGNFIVGEAKSQANLTVGQVDRSTNEQTAKITLNKTIFTHTITSSEANITVRGNFTDDSGKVIRNSISGTGSVTFKVWSGDRNVSYTVSKRYYDTKTGNISVDSNGKTTNVTLNKTKYYSNSQSYTVHDTSTWYSPLKAKWNETGNLKDSGAELRLRRSGENGTVTLTFSGAVNNTDNWQLYINGYKVGTDANRSSMTVTVRDGSGNNLTNETLNFANKDTDYNKTYPYNNKNIRTVTIRFNTSSGTDKRFWLSSVYIETRN